MTADLGSAATIRLRKISEIDRLLWTLGVLAVAAVAYVYGLKLNTPPIRSDGFGYQAFLTAFFIDHDLTFKTFAVRIFNGDVPTWTGITLYPETGNYLDKYPIGTALLQLPFFLLADRVTVLFGLNRSGLSLPYQIANVASAIFYFLLGVRLISSALRDQFDGTIVRLTILLFVFGTSAFHYATYDGSFSHIYSFALVAGFVKLSLQYSAAPKIGIAALGGAIFGLITITRIPNGIVGLIAFGIWIHVVLATLPRVAPLRDGAMFMLCAAIAVTPQLLYWQLVTGHPLIYSYGDEEYNWTDPQVMNFLFSIKKGLLFWSPALVISLIGFFAMPSRLRVFGACAFACMAIHVYLCSAWHSWSFGGGYGSRPFVDMMAILALPMAAGISFLAAHSSMFTARVIAAVLIGLNLILMNGYWIGVIPFGGPTPSEFRNMPEKYFAVLTRRLHRRAND
jgi:hypothetical protein